MPPRRRPGRPPWLQETRADGGADAAEHDQAARDDWEPGDLDAGWGIPDPTTSWVNPKNATGHSAADPWASDRPADRRASSRPADGRLRPRDPRDGPSRASGAHAKPPASAGMRKAVTVAGILGGAMVLAIALVAVVVLRNNSPASSATAAGLANAKTSAGGTPTVAVSASAQAKKAKLAASPKATAKAGAAHPAAAGPASSTLTVPAGWKLAFDPSFSGSSLNTSTWATCYDPSNESAGCTNNPSTENEWYLPSQVSVNGGTLNLTAKRETTQGTSSSGAPMTYGCRSGMVTSQPGFNFTYGLIQVTAKLPYGPGLWPALWLEPSNGDWPPELDIMEHWYSQQDYKVYDHFTNATDYLGGPVTTPVNLSAGYNTFSLLWTSSQVTWYLNGTKVYSTTTHVPQQAMYFIANVADRNPVNGTTALVSGACTGTMQISSVKVWTP